MDASVSIFRPLAQQLSYLFDYKNKFRDLRSKVQELKDARERVQQAVDSANRKGEVVSDDVQRWLTEVNEKISDRATKQLLEDDDDVKMKCFAGFCPDFKSRYLLSKKAKKEADAITQLLTKKDAFNTVSNLPAAEVTDIIKPVEEVETFGSRSVAFDGVMAAMEDDTVSIIGVYEENIDVRTSRICERLKEEKKVVLDDILVSLNLRALRITSLDEHKVCDILMISRMSDVLKLIDSHPNVSIETLEEDEARNMFKRMVDHIVKRCYLQSIAIEVAKRCAGLSIVIATIAKTLKPKENLLEWGDALRQLSKPFEQNFKEIRPDAYSTTDLSYKFLKGEELEPIFLLYSILGPDVTVEDLLRSSTGLGFIHDVNMLEESRDRVLTLVDILKAPCLLFEGSNPTHFDMHDVVHDVVQSLASRDLYWLAFFKKWSDKKKAKESQSTSFQNVEVSCPVLEELKLDSISGIEKIWHADDLLPLISSAVQSLTSLTVRKCSKLKSVFTSSIIKSFVQLKTFEISGCDKKKEVIQGILTTQEPISDIIRLLSKLDFSDLEFLPKLKRFCCSINPIKFSFIMYLLIREFPYLNSPEHIVS